MGQTFDFQIVGISFIQEHSKSTASMITYQPASSEMQGGQREEEWEMFSDIVSFLDKMPLGLWIQKNFFSGRKYDDRKKGDLPSKVLE